MQKAIKIQAMKVHAFRLKRGQDLRSEIDAFVASKNIKAAVVLTCVGNLEKAVLRMADERITNEYEESLEILSLVGTMESGNSHLHISVSDKDGRVIGGHLKHGSLVGFTAEIVIGEIDDLEFRREKDPDTGFQELIVKEI